MPGVPLVLTLRPFTSTDAWCRPIRGARVDLWHCDARGAYSGVQDRGTGGRDFLRGYQVTDDAGEVRFVTVYPGWYPGRTAHIHAKVRLFDPFGEVTTEMSTQLFFDDTVTDAVLEKEPYAGRGPRDTRNVDDPILRGHSAPLRRRRGRLSMHGRDRRWRALPPVWTGRCLLGSTRVEWTGPPGVRPIVYESSASGRTRCALLGGTARQAV